MVCKLVYDNARAKDQLKVLVLREADSIALIFNKL